MGEKKEEWKKEKGRKLKERHKDVRAHVCALMVCLRFFRSTTLGIWVMLTSLESTGVLEGTKQVNVTEGEKCGFSTIYCVKLVTQCQITFIKMLIGNGDREES